MSNGANEQVNESVVNEINDLVGDTPAPTSDDIQTGDSQDAGPPSSAASVEAPPAEGAPLAEPSASEAKVAPSAPPVTPVPPVVAPPPEVPLTREQELERDNAQLRDELLKFSNKFMGVEQAPAVRPAVQPAVQRQPQMLNFIKDDAMFDETMKSSENMNALLTVVVNTAVERAQLVVPHLVTQLVEHQVTMKTAANEFFVGNRDLFPHRSFVGFVANELTAKHPEWDLPKVMEETAKESRRRLTLRQAAGGQVQTQEGSPSSSPGARQSVGPAFVPRGGGRRGSNEGSQLTAVEKEINDLISDIV